MSAAVFAFYLFATSALAGGLFTVISRNPVHSVLWLILSFLSAAGLFVLLGAEFVAMLLVIVYVGAVAVLFLFVVMMLDVDFAELKAEMARYMPLALLIALVILMQFVMAFGAWESNAAAEGLRAQISVTSKGTAAFSLMDKNSKVVSMLTCSADGIAQLAYMKDGKVRMTLSETSSGNLGMLLSDTGGKQKVALIVGKSGEGSLLLNGKKQ